MSGGGSSTSMNIPEWAVPYIQNVGNQAEGMYSSGDLGQVAGASGLQNAAFGAGANAMMSTAGQGLDALQGQQGRLAAMAESGGYDTKALKDRAILEAGQRTAQLGTAYGASGTLGSARQMVHQGAQDAATAAEFATIDRDAAQQMFNNRMAAESGIGQSVGASSQIAGNTASGLANLGNQQRGITQQELDAPWQSLQRYASTIYGNPARSQTTQGGK